MQKLKSVVLYALCAVLLNACDKKLNCVDPIGIFEYFPYYAGDTLCFSNGSDTVAYAITKSFDGYYPPDDYFCEYLGGCDLRLLTDTNTGNNRHRGIRIETVIISESYFMHEQSWIGEFTFCIGNFKPFDSYARVEFDYEGKIISGLPDTLYAREGYYNDTMWIVKDVGIVGFTYNKSSSERVYTLVQHTPYSAEGIATKKPVVQ